MLDVPRALGLPAPDPTCAHPARSLSASLRLLEEWDLTERFPLVVVHRGGQQPGW